MKHDEHSTEKDNSAKTRFQRNVCSQGNPVKLLAAMERKGPKHVRQKQHRTGTVLALSSPFVNRDTCGKVVAESRRECPIVVSETPHSPGKYQRSSSLVCKRAWMKRFRIFEDSVPFSLVIKQSVQKNTSTERQAFHWVPDSTLGVGAWGGSSP